MITLKKIEVGYSNTLISIDDLTLGAGKLHVVAGRNGSGKSTLLKTIAGMCPPISGKLQLMSANSSTIKHKEYARIACYIGNRNEISDGMRLVDIVSHGRIPFLSLFGSMKTHDLDVINQSMELSGISKIKDQLALSSSDGEIQKAFIASGLAQETPIILLDEPTAHLDLASRREFWKLLKHLCKSENKCIVIASHNVDMAKEFADTMHIIYKNSMIKNGQQGYDEAYSYLKGEL